MAGGEEWAAGLPGGFKVGAFEQAAELEDVFGTGLAPEHARLVEPPLDDRLASGFDHAAAHPVPQQVGRRVDRGYFVLSLQSHRLWLRFILLVWRWRLEIPPLSFFVETFYASVANRKMAGSNTG